MELGVGSEEIGNSFSSIDTAPLPHFVTGRAALFTYVLRLILFLFTFPLATFPFFQARLDWEV
jgi:hypothetical protein